MEFIKVFLLLSMTITTTYIITDAAPQFSFDNVLSPPRLNLCEVYIRHHGYWNCNSVCGTSNATMNSTMNATMNAAMNVATTMNPVTTTSAAMTTTAAATTTTAATTTMAAAAVMAG